MRRSDNQTRTHDYTSLSWRRNWLSPLLFVFCLLPVTLLADDYGDAPDAGLGTDTGNYETILAADGPRHTVVANLYIGTTAPDDDNGILRNATATADDSTGTADEGGITLPDLLAVATSYSVDIVVENQVGSAATLYGFIDFDQSGSFDEDEATTVAVPDTTSGSVTLVFTVPSDITSGTTYMRLRLTTDSLTNGGGGVDERSLGSATDGEVEDLTIVVSGDTLDWGDAPNGYGTLSSSTGASHVIDSLLRIGTSIDAESDGQPDTVAEGDDLAGSSDEDGVSSFPSIAASATSFDYLVNVKVKNSKTTAATLFGWIDFDGNGTFDTDEAASANVPVSTDGNILLTWSDVAGIGPDINAGLTYVRFRITTDTITSSDTGGEFSDGEVEDYDLIIFETENCQVGPSTLLPISALDFDGAVLESGTDLAVGAIYRFTGEFGTGVLAGIDALIEITEENGANLIQFDIPETTTGRDEAFQPLVDLTNDPGEGYVEFEITLVKAGTSNPVEPAPTFLASAIDVDGDNDDLREFVEFYKPFGTVYREAGPPTPTVLDLIDQGSFYRLIPTNTNVNPGIVFTATENIATLRYDGTAQFLYRAGSTNLDGTSGNRQNALSFGCIEFDGLLTDTVSVDFGDAPEEYPTLLKDQGALHTVIGGIGLGANIDAEFEGLPDVNALGDDDDGSPDDEDAVTVSAVSLSGLRVTPGDSLDFDVVTVGTGTLSAWVDWDGDGVWEAGTETLTTIASTGATETMSTTVPLTAASGTTYARFRYTSDAGISFDGGATNGEVEDYAFVVARADYGDAPDGGTGTSRNDYTTLERTLGPSHEVPASPTVYLGLIQPDTDNGQLEGLDTLADDLDFTDDEDGAFLAGDPLQDKTLFRTRTYDFEIAITGGGYLNLWIDYNRDGDFTDTVGGESEQVINDEDHTGNTGTNTVTVPVLIPGPSVVGLTYVRIRYCSTVDDCDTIGGAALDGEVEDFRVDIEVITDDAIISGFVFEDNGADPGMGGIAYNGLVDGNEQGISGLTVKLLFDDDFLTLPGCTGVEAVLAQDETAGDGSYSIRPQPEDEGKAACLVVETPVNDISISESSGGNPVSSVSAFDDVATLTVPSAGTVWTNINFGDIAIPRFTPDRQGSVGAGSSVSYIHFYTATTEATVDFTLTDQSDNPAGLSWSDVLYLDLNCDGDITGVETTASVTGVSVEAGEQVCLVVRIFTPANAPPDALHSRRLEADSTFTGTGQTSNAVVTDITIVAAGQLRLVKTVRNIGPNGILDGGGDDVDLTDQTFNNGRPGDVLRYVLRFTNEGSLPLQSLTVTDITPAYTSLNAAITCPSLPPDLTLCVESTPDGTNAIGYEGLLQWDFTGPLATGAQGSVSFDVKVDD